MKQKEIANATRNSILDAANDVVLLQGVNALTLDAVAAQAGISKGGLLYHFPSKNKLIESMIEQLIAEFNAALDAELAKNNQDWLSAYICASFQSNPKLDKVSSALFVAVANEPELLKPLQAHYENWQEKASATASTPEIGTVIRMTIDGLWLADSLNFAPPAPEEREKMRNILLSFVRKESL